ncbi:MAG: protease modulator HflC [Candidatus Hydrogenedentota bacterium]
MQKAYLISGIVLAVIAAGVFIIFGSAYVVDEREQAVVTRFNRPVHVVLGAKHGDVDAPNFEERRQGVHDSVREVAGEGGLDMEGADSESDIRVSEGAGLYFKMPFIDEVHRMPNVVLEYDAPPWEMHLADQKLIRVDNFARWRIENPLLFLVRMRTETRAHNRLRDDINDQMRGEIGGNSLTEVIRTTNRFEDRRPAFLEELEDGLGEGVEEMVQEDFYHDSPIREPIERGREEIMRDITRAVDEGVGEWGVRVLDVRIRRAELLEENLEAVFQRMEAERSRLSKGYRSEGERQASIIEGQTDRRVEVLTANAERDAEILRGEGDAEAAGMFGEAFAAHSEVYEFIRTLDLIEQSTPPDSELIVGLDTSIYRLLRSPHISMEPGDILDDRQHAPAEPPSEPVPEAPAASPEVEDMELDEEVAPDEELDTPLMGDEDGEAAPDENEEDGG